MRRVIGIVVACGLWMPSAQATVIVDHRHLNCGARTSAECTDALRLALETPALNLSNKTLTDTVHGSVSVSFCDDRTLGQDVLAFKDGSKQVATTDNIGPWLAEQGHQVLAIVGNTVTCDSIIRVELYDQDEDPTDVVLPNGKLKHVHDAGLHGPHLCTFRKPVVMPSDQDVHDKLKAVVLP